MFTFVIAGAKWRSRISLSSLVRSRSSWPFVVVSVSFLFPVACIRGTDTLIFSPRTLLSAATSAPAVTGTAASAALPFPRGVRAAAPLSPASRWGTRSSVGQVRFGASAVLSVGFLRVIRLSLFLIFAVIVRISFFAIFLTRSRTSLP